MLSFMTTGKGKTAIFSLLRAQYMPGIVPSSSYHLRLMIKFELCILLFPFYRKWRLSYALKQKLHEKRNSEAKQLFSFF